MDIILSLEEVRLIEAGGLINAMRAIRQRTSCDLLEAKQAVTRYQARGLVGALTMARDMASDLRDTTTMDVLNVLITRLNS